jgi:hypothetical protein
MEQMAVVGCPKCGKPCAKIGWLATKGWVMMRRLRCGCGPARDEAKAKLTAEVDKGLKVWDEELALHGFAVLPRVWGRDRGILGRLVKAYGVAEVAATMRAWLRFRQSSKLTATLVGFQGAFEQTYQRRHQR